MKNDYLEHHGIAGQKWGHQNGPPYPLNPEKDYSKAEKTANKITKRISKTDSKFEKRRAKSEKLKTKADNYKVKRDKNLYGFLGSESKAKNFNYKYKKTLAKANSLEYKNIRDMQKTVKYVDKLVKKLDKSGTDITISSADKAKVDSFIKRIENDRKNKDLAYNINSYF